MAQPSFVTPSTIQLMEQGGSLSTRLVMLGAEAADTVRAAAKRRTRIWKREAIVDFGGFQLSNSNIWRRRDSTTKRNANRLWEKRCRLLLWIHRATTNTIRRMEETERDPYIVPYSTNQISRFSLPPHTSTACTQCPRCAMSPPPNTNKGGQELDTRAKQPVPSLNGGVFSSNGRVYHSPQSKSNKAD